MCIRDRIQAGQEILVAAIRPRIREQAVVQVDLRRHRMRRADPGDIALDLDAVRARRAAARLRQVLGLHLDYCLLYTSRCV